MKPLIHRNAPRAVRLASMTLLLSASVLSPALAGDETAPGGPEQGVQTDLDIPGDTTKYFGQRSNQYRDIGRRLAKVDLDADFNYDGVIDNDDPADNGAFQQTPPGLVLGKGELSKLVIRLSPYHLDFRGQAVVSIQVDGVNRADKTGRFASIEEEMGSVGHIRVWRDASRKELILDSRDPQRRVFEWTIDDNKYPANIPGIVPRTLFAEGVGESGQFSGDIRLLVTVFHRVPGEEPEPVYEDPKSGLSSKGGVEPAETEKERDCLPDAPKRFATSYDHILLTVRPGGHPKEYISENSDGVWK